MILNGWHRLFTVCTAAYISICIYIGYNNYPTLRDLETQVRTEYARQQQVADREKRAVEETECKRKYSEAQSRLVSRDNQNSGFMSKLADPNVPESEKRALIESMRIKSPDFSAINKAFGDCMKRVGMPKPWETERAVAEVNEISTIVEIKRPALAAQQKQVIYETTGRALVGPIVIYLLGIVIAWVLRGFRQSKPGA